MTNNGNNRRSSFFTLCFSLIPGAGEMYFGLYHQGLSLMGWVCALFALSSITQIGELICFFPVIWLFSFFHVHNLRRMSVEEFAKVEDKWLFPSDWVNFMDGQKTKKYVAVGLLVIGGLMLWDVLLQFIGLYFDNMWWFRGISTRLILGILILAIGIHMLVKVGKNKEDEEEEDDEEEQEDDEDAAEDEIVEK